MLPAACLSLFALFYAPAPVAPQARQIRVAAASDLQTVMPQIAKFFQEQTNIRVDLSFGSSGSLFEQIQNGAPFDIFFSADDQFPARLIQSNLTKPRSAVVYAVGSLVLWMPPNARCDPRAEKWNCLLQPGVAKIAIANPAHAPYGRAAVAALQSAHLYDRVRAELVLGENISQAAQFAQSGNAQAGILAYSQTRSAAMRGGKQWEIPKENYPRIEQTAIILKSSKDQLAAEEFVKFVTEGPGRALLEQFGFQPPPAPAQPIERHK
jgi:molybdate transport system substrate-binding protein